MTLGATELRAYGTAHGAELAMIAQRDALRRGDVHRLLFWSERWRATALATRSTPLRQDRQLAAELSALRSVIRLLGTSEMPAPRRAALERERRRFEAAGQARPPRSPGSRVPGGQEVGLRTLLAGTGGRRPLEVLEGGGRP